MVDSVKNLYTVIFSKTNQNFWMIQNYLPDITNIPSGLKEASSVELQETGVTLYVDNCVHMIKRQQSQRKAFKAEINELKEVKPD